MKLQNKVQKVVCYIVLATCAIAFFFALGLATNFFNLMFIRVLGIRGGNLFKEIQPFNRKLVSSIIIMIVLVVSLFISRTHIRRRYYISNYIATILVVAVNISVSIWGILNVLEFRNRFLTEVDFETWATYPQYQYTESTFWLDANIVVLILVVIASLLLLGNLIWKIRLMKYEDKLLSGFINPEIVKEG